MSQGENRKQGSGKSPKQENGIVKPPNRSSPHEVSLNYQMEAGGQANSSLVVVWSSSLVNYDFKTALKDRGHDEDKYTKLISLISEHQGKEYWNHRKFNLLICSHSLTQTS